MKRTALLFAFCVDDYTAKQTPHITSSFPSCATSYLMTTPPNADLAGPDEYRSAFGSAENEYLFSSEGFNIFEPVVIIIKCVLGCKQASVRDLTVGERHKAICRTLHTSLKPSIS